MRCLQRKQVSEDSAAVFEVVDTEIPSVAEDEVLVEVKACSLSPVNTKILKEAFKRDPQEALVLCVGHDVSGVIKSVGSRVASVKEGDEVVGVLPLDTATSGCGEFCVFKEFDIVKKPNRVSHEDAAGTVGDAVRAYTALHYHTHVCAGDTVLIMDGATPSGNIAVQLAQLWGAKIMTTYSTLPEKQFLESFHSNLAQILELNQRSTLLVSSVMEETGGVGVDCVVDNGVRLFSNEEDIALLGEKSKYPKPHKVDVISCLGFAGKWVTSHPDLQLDPPDCQQLFLRNASVSFLFPPAWTLMHAQHGRYQHILIDIMEKLDKGSLKCKIAQRVSLDEAATTLKGLEDVRVGKVVLKM
ncbi:quinone oxidoreductase-like protein 1 [Littorina saxatilis]|uniref:Enoyl reductase (ER) domain-containing protein n=1 Tax=Littorina saxatilis TaxID=31220 RepID=A0AAN9BNK1_9CAEN